MSTTTAAEMGQKWQHAVENGEMEEAQAIVAAAGGDTSFLQDVCLDLLNLIWSRIDCTPTIQHIIDAGYNNWHKDKSWHRALSISLAEPEKALILARQLLTIARTNSSLCMPEADLQEYILEPPYKKVIMEAGKERLRMLREEGVEFTMHKPFDFKDWPAGGLVWEEARPKSRDIYDWGVKHASEDDSMCPDDYRRILQSLPFEVDIEQMVKTKELRHAGFLAQKNSNNQNKDANSDNDSDGDGDDDDDDDDWSGYKLTKKWLREVHDGHVAKAKALEQQGDVMEALCAGDNVSICFGSVLKLDNAIDVLEYLDSTSYDYWDHDGEWYDVLRTARDMPDGDYAVLRKLIQITLTFGDPSRPIEFYLANIVGLLRDERAEVHEPLALLRVYKEEGLESVEGFTVDLKGWPAGRKLWKEQGGNSGHVAKKQRCE